MTVPLIFQDIICGPSQHTKEYLEIYLPMLQMDLLALASHIIYTIQPIQYIYTYIYLLHDEAIHQR